MACGVLLLVPCAVLIDQTHHREVLIMVEMVRNDAGTLPAYAWPGGYPLIYVLVSGDVLCSDCADKESDQRNLTQDTHWEGEPEACAECGKAIPSAYGTRERVASLVLPDGTAYEGRQPLDSNGDPITDLATCGTCGFTWDDALISAVTPVPAGRCPNEREAHRERE
jgi:hypothetical protein